MRISESKKILRNTPKFVLPIQEFTSALFINLIHSVFSSVICSQTAGVNCCGIPLLKCLMSLWNHYSVSTETNFFHFCTQFLISPLANIIKMWIFLFHRNCNAINERLLRDLFRSLLLFVVKEWKWHWISLAWIYGFPAYYRFSNHSKKFSRLSFFL